MAMQTWTRGKKNGKANWSNTTKVDLLKLYLATGNLVASATALKVPEATARNWKSQEWWKQMEAEFRAQEKLQLSSKLKKIMESGMSVIAYNMENGDARYDSKTGAIIRVPVSMKDAHKVVSDLIDKIDMLEGQDVETPEETVTVNQKLDMIAQRFKELADKVQAKPDVVVTDVVEITSTQEGT